MLHGKQSLWFVAGRLVAASAAGVAWLIGTAWGAPEKGLNLNENFNYARRPTHSVCNSSGITNLADPQEDSSFLAACDLDCVQCAKGRCSIGSNQRCQLAAASRAAAEQEASPLNASGQFGPSLYIMTDAGEVPASLIMGVPAENQIVIVEAPDGATLMTSTGEPVKVVMRVDQSGPIPQAPAAAPSTQ